MAVQATKMFSKLLSETDIKKRLAIPEKILDFLPDFNGTHAVKIDLMYGTRIWPIFCSIRKKGYKKPVFSGGWRNFVICNNLNVGDKITMYKVQDEDGFSHYRVEVEKPASKQSGVSLNHEVNETTVTCSRKARYFWHEQEQTPDAPIKQEGAIMGIANVVATDAFVDHVIAKPNVRIFGTNLSDEATKKARFKTEQKTEMKCFGIPKEQKTEMKCFGIPKDIGIGELPLLSHYMAKEKREIKFFGLAEGGAMAYGTSQLSVAGEACCKIITDQRLSLDLDLVLRQPTPYAGVVNLDLTLAPPTLDGGVQEAPLFAHSKQKVGRFETEESRNRSTSTGAFQDCRVGFRG